VDFSTNKFAATCLTKKIYTFSCGFYPGKSVRKVTTYLPLKNIVGNKF
jgi:hypothetical protein